MKKIFTILFILSSLFSFSQSLVISQVYGAGGNSGSVYTNDFIELFNPTGSSININNWSVQYNSATSTTTTWQKTKLPNVSIMPGQYYLIAEAQGSGGTTALPAPDAVGVISMSGTAGKVVLVSDTNAIAIACPSTNVIDKVGYGATSACFEGSAPTPAFGSNTNSVFRNNSGCTDGNDNAADFTTAPAMPRNTASPLHTCGVISPSLMAAPLSLADFGSIVTGSNSSSLSFSLSGSNLTGAPGNITITASSTDFQVSTDNSTWNTSVVVAYGAAALLSTPVYVRFTPQSTGIKTGSINISGGGGVVSVAVNGTGLAAVVPVLAASLLTGFGNVCVNSVTTPGSFTISGSNLNAAAVTVGPLAGYTFATTAGGTYSPSLNLSQAGGPYSQTVFVVFTPGAAQSYNGNIPVTGGGATSITVAAAGTGANLPPVETTGSAGNITAFNALLPGGIADSGCTIITSYGIEYSTVNGFAGGTGIRLNSSNLTNGSFSSAAEGLSASTTYYFKSFATNAGGTTYGPQVRFQTLACTAPAITTGLATMITNSTAVVAGAISDTGCTAISAYGLEYSGVRSFANGFVTRINVTGSPANNFFANLTDLVQGGKYYYRAFATNQGGTSYGATDSFDVLRIPGGLTIYSNPVLRGGMLRYSVDSIHNGYYEVQLFSSTGQLLYTRKIPTQVGFIYDSFLIPVAMEKGVYVFKVINNSGYMAHKTILIL